MMHLEITAHKGRGDGFDYAWDYGARPGKHARLNAVLSAIAKQVGESVPDQDQYTDGSVGWEIDDFTWARMPARLLRRIQASPDICVTD